MADSRIEHFLAAARDLAAGISVGEVDKNEATAAVGGAIVSMDLELQRVLDEARAIRARFQRQRRAAQ